MHAFILGRCGEHRFDSCCAVDFVVLWVVFWSSRRLHAAQDRQPVKGELLKFFLTEALNDTLGGALFY